MYFNSGISSLWWLDSCSPSVSISSVHQGWEETLSNRLSWSARFSLFWSFSNLNIHHSSIEIFALTTVLCSSLLLAHFLGSSAVIALHICANWLTASQLFRFRLAFCTRYLLRASIDIPRNHMHQNNMPLWGAFLEDHWQDWSRLHGRSEASCSPPSNHSCFRWLLDIAAHRLSQRGSRTY